MDRNAKNCLQAGPRVETLREREQTTGRFRDERSSAPRRQDLQGRCSLCDPPLRCFDIRTALF
jgi:hypothetical protein